MDRRRDFAIFWSLCVDPTSEERCCIISVANSAGTRCKRVFQQTMGGWRALGVNGRTLPPGYPTLPDYLRRGLEIVFVGINPGLFSAQQGHYFARLTSRFWPAFSQSRLSKPVRLGLGVELLRPEHDRELPRFGFGLTDVVKRASSNASQLSPHDFEAGVPLLVHKLRRYRPKIACFHGLTAYRPFASVVLRTVHPLLGPQPQSIASTQLYVVPNPSPANAHFTLSDQTAWYDRLAAFLESLTDC